MGLNFHIQTDIPLAPIAEAASLAEHILANQVAKDTEPFVPAQSKSLRNRTQILGDTILYPGPYARYLYFGKVMVDSQTGKGPRPIALKSGGLIFRFRKGAKLRPTDRPLDIKKNVSSEAQSHWFEASKAANLEKWLRVAGRAMKHELR